MTTYIALLRAINVSGKNMIKMAELKQMCEQIGLAKVQTYIQSGNVLFQSAEGPDTLRERIEAGILATFGLTVTVILRTAAELAAVIERCPLPEHEHLYVTFLAGAPSPEGIERLMAFQAEHEEVQVLGQEVYIIYREGAGRTKLTNAVLEKRLGVASTARNWRTTTKLAELAGALS